MLPDIVRVLAPATASFVIGMAITPLVTLYLYKYKAWKKRPGKQALDGSAALTILGIALFVRFVPEAGLFKLDFLSRNQTWIPFATLLVGAFVGMADDILTIRVGGRGVPLSLRLSLVVLLSSFIGWWFWEKLDVTAVNIPFGAPLEVGWLVIPLFVTISLALYASGVIDGIDGLSGGVFGSIFASYAIISFAQDQIDLAAFSAAVLGGI